MKALLVSVNDSSSWYEVKRIQQCLIDMGVEVDHFFYEDWEIRFDSIKGATFYCQKHQVKLEDFAMGYFRSSIINTKSHTNLKVVLIAEMMNRGGFVINGKSLLNYMHFSKLIQHYRFSQENLPHIATYYSSREGLGKYSFEYPLIMKKGLSSSGEDVVKVDNVDELIKVTEKYHYSELLFQPFISAGEDFRVIVVEGKAIGAMRREVVEGGYLSNISQGGKGSKAKLNKDLRYVAEKASRIFDLDLCGVDIIYEAGQPHVLEVNRIPQFQGFEKATGIDVAQIIARLMRKKVR
jgi:RimK family alpha-L-glutamate ligase